ncbi:LOW QUALITY PROTEIN: Mucolipin-2, partial [Galemys pyrenaicus]
TVVAGRAGRPHRWALGTERGIPGQVQRSDLASSSSCPSGGRTMPGSVEALDMPVWNGVLYLSGEPSCRSVPQGALGSAFRVPPTSYDPSKGTLDSISRGLPSVLHRRLYPPQLLGPLTSSVLRTSASRARGAGWITRVKISSGQQAPPARSPRRAATGRSGGSGRGGNVWPRAALAGRPDLSRSRSVASAARAVSRSPRDPRRLRSNADPSAPRRPREGGREPSSLRYERVSGLRILRVVESLDDRGMARQPYRFPQTGKAETGSGAFRLTVRNAMAHVDSEVKEECLRQDLRFYFMSPCEKYRARHQIPWKLGLQILKIVMVTTQLVRFGLSNQLVVAFKEENMVAFKHLFLRGYSGIDEDDYSCSIYTQEDYHRLKNISVGTLAYGENEDNRTGLKVCKQHYKKGTMFPPNETLNIDSDIEVDCVHLALQSLCQDLQDWKNSPFFRLEFYRLKSPSPGNEDGDSREEMQNDDNLYLVVCFLFRLLQVEISFHLKGIDLQTIHSRELPDCYIIFDNKAHSGKIKIYFNSEAKIEECKDLNISGSIQKNTQYVLIFDAFVIVICLASLILCTRSIILALRLRKRFLNFFLEKYKRRVCHADQCEFINRWYILVIISDLMTIVGSILKMEIKAKNLTNYDLCSILLGTSTLFVWVGVIRYLGYFQTYNVLILTMEVSLPKVLRFCACAGMIYLGYTFCGWIVLGPYHAKFENLNTVAECLFSLVNGDDMFATFAHIQQKSILVWLFSRVYLYSFISLFIYMILSLFIALITDSYDTIKKYQQNEFPETDLQEFLKEDSSKEEYQEEASAFLSCMCCLRRSVLCLTRSPCSEMSGRAAFVKSPS